MILKCIKSFTTNSGVCFVENEIYLFSIIRGLIVFYKNDEHFQINEKDIIDNFKYAF